MKTKKTLIKKPDSTKLITLHNLQDTSNPKKNRKRVGRGIGSGRGKTSTAGHKGRRSRSGHKISAAFEGGQMPFYRRIPKKRGFRPANKIFYQIVNLNRITQREMKIVDKETLFAEKLIRKLDQPIKILGVGELNFAVTFKVNAVSETAEKKIKAAKGKIEII